VTEQKIITKSGRAFLAVILSAVAYLKGFAEASVVRIFISLSAETAWTGVACVGTLPFGL